MAAFLLFVLGFWATAVFIDRLSVARRFDDNVQFDLWRALLGALMGSGLASCLFFVVWLTGILSLCDKARRATIASWVAVVLTILATVFGFLFTGSGQAGNSVDTTLAKGARPITVLAALSQLPGLITFLALRFVATEEASWQESGLCRVRLVLRLRIELRRVLAALGAFLTLIVVTAGMRRRALLALDPKHPIPSEVVLLYGLVFAVILGLFYAVAAGAIDRRGAHLLDEFAPLPDPADPALSDAMRHRNELALLMGSGGTWGTFQTTVVIAAPLLTGLLGSATGS